MPLAFLLPLLLLHHASIPVLPCRLPKLDGPVSNILSVHFSQRFHEVVWIFEAYKSVTLFFFEGGGSKVLFCPVLGWGNVCVCAGM